MNNENKEVERVIQEVISKETKKASHPKLRLNLQRCYACGKPMISGYRWYHGDQDDLICKECARTTIHTDTAYAGSRVIEIPEETDLAAYIILRMK